MQNVENPPHTQKNLTSEIPAHLQPGSDMCGYLKHMTSKIWAVCMKWLPLIKHQKIVLES